MPRHNIFLRTLQHWWLVWRAGCQFGAEFEGYGLLLCAWADVLCYPQLVCIHFLMVIQQHVTCPSVGTDGPGSDGTAGERQTQISNAVEKLPDRTSETGKRHREFFFFLTNKTAFGGKARGCQFNVFPQQQWRWSGSRFKEWTVSASRRRRKCLRQLDLCSIMTAGRPTGTA